MTVADYCNAIDRGEIVVNRDYQRSDKVWPLTARSFLIESIILGFPIPKISLYSKTDLKTRQPYKEIVDGQQRTVAITDFFHGKLILSSTSDEDDFRGRSYEQLDSELQQKFVDYPLSVDLFVGASDQDVRETFRRMNSYTIPLNPEEQRHAIYQGKFKWSVYKIARKYEDVFSRIGAFSDKNFVRMADLKLLTEIIHAYFHGVTTTNKGALNQMYRGFDKKFEKEKLIEEQIGKSIEILAQLEAIHNGPLVKPYMVYSLVLAIWHKMFGVPKMAEDFPRPKGRKIDLDIAQENLSELAAAVNEDDVDGKFSEFVNASVDRTNVKSQRETRIRWMLSAI
jgi:hypothetical protein